MGNDNDKSKKKKTGDEFNTEDNIEAAIKIAKRIGKKKKSDLKNQDVSHGVEGLGGDVEDVTV